MPINKTNIDLLHEPCEPVAAEFGDDPEEASKLMNEVDLDGPKLAGEIAIAQRWQHALGGAIIKDPTELFESGASATTAQANHETKGVVRDVEPNNLSATLTGREGW